MVAKQMTDTRNTMSFDFFSKSGLVEKRPCPVASAPQPKKHKVSASFSDMYAVAKATAKPAVVTQTGLAIKPHARSIVEGGQSTLDTHLPKHAARARQLEEANKAAGALIVRTDGKVLLLQERKYKDKWIQPGGKPDPSDTGPLATATRELWEETRIRLGALKQLGVVDGDQYFRTFVLEAPMNLAVDISHDASVLNYAWLDPATADADMHYRARVLFDKKLVQRFFPQPSKDMVVEEAPAPKPVSNSPQVAKGQTFTEILSLDALQYLCKLKYSDFLKVFPQPEMDKTGHIDTLPEQYQMMKDFCKSAQQHGKQVTVGDVQAVEIERAYLPTQSSPSGRVFASGDQSTGLALQRLWTKVRSVLTREFTVDIDMKNAHPTILRNLCESEFPHEEFWHPLNNYVDRRQEVLNELQSAGIQQPKIVILKSMNSEWSVNKVFKRPIPKKCEKYYALDGCFKTIQKRLEKLPKYKDLHPDKRTPNHRGVFLNKILCQSENALLQEAMQLVGGSRVVAPMFDGMLVRGQPKDVPALLTKLNERFKNRIVWDHKEHDNDIQVNLEYEGLPCYIADTDVTLMDHLVGHFSGKLARCRSALWFVGETCTTVILPGDRTQGALFEHHVIAELRLCEVFIGEHNQCDSMAALRSLCSSLMVQAPIDPEFETKYWTSNPDDNYSRGIRMWNERCIHLLQKSVFLYEESGEVEELKPDELQRNMRALTEYRDARV
jgi:8-oxo-dGTP pyrophosphatase MutT (NUDIX family)